MGRWHKAFREGREDIEDEQRTGRPSTSHTLDSVAKVKAVLDSDRLLSVRLIADKVGLPKSIVHEIGYDAWQNRWQRCVDVQGCYFEEY